jgi:hypothetical protein
MAQEEPRAKEGTLSGHDLGNVEICDFAAIARPEIGIIRGVGITLEDLILTDGHDEDVVQLRQASALMLVDVTRRAIDELEEKLEAASDWFRSTGLFDLVMERRRQGAPPAGRAGDAAEKKAA